MILVVICEVNEIYKNECEVSFCQRICYNSVVFFAQNYLLFASIDAETGRALV